MILITGASGTVGRFVLAEALQCGQPVRAMYRSAEEAAKAPAAAQAVIADFADPASLDAALQGVSAVYIVCSPIPQLVALEGNVLDAAQRAGVKHVVLNSALGAGDYDKSFPSWHRQVEQKLESSGMSYTILRPNGFFQNIATYYAPTIRTQNAFYSTVGDARISHLDVRDIATVAARALVDPSHAGKTYELNGPEAVTYAEVAAKISALVGRVVTYVNIPDEAQRQAMLGVGMPEWQVNALLELQQYYAMDRAGKTDGLLASLIGREPVTLDQYLRETAASYSA